MFASQETSGVIVELFLEKSLSCWGFLLVFRPLFTLICRVRFPRYLNKNNSSAGTNTRNVRLTSCDASAQTERKRTLSSPETRAIFHSLCAIHASFYTIVCILCSSVLIFCVKVSPSSARFLLMLFPSVGGIFKWCSGDLAFFLGNLWPFWVPWVWFQRSACKYDISVTSHRIWWHYGTTGKQRKSTFCR